MGHSPRAPDTLVEVVLDDRSAARGDGRLSSWRVLGLSIVISLITATLIFLALQLFIIRPMQRMTAEMVRFRGDPEMPLEGPPSTRSDEIGIAERGVRADARRGPALAQQKERLAALGTAVNKINHDLRGILSTARLVADRLTGSGDPDVARRCRRWRRRSTARSIFAPTS